MKDPARCVVHVAHVLAQPHHRGKVLKAAAVTAPLVYHLYRAVTKGSLKRDVIDFECNFHSQSLRNSTNHLHDLHHVAGQAVQELRGQRQEISEDERAAQRVCLYGERLEQVVPAARGRRVRAARGGRMFVSGGGGGVTCRRAVQGRRA